MFRMPFNKSSLIFTSTNSPTSPNLPKKGSKIGQWRPHKKPVRVYWFFLFWCKTDKMNLKELWFKSFLTLSLYFHQSKIIIYKIAKYFLSIKKRGLTLLFIFCCYISYSLIYNKYSFCEIFNLDAIHSVCNAIKLDGGLCSC